jgi:phosphonopyruvate decarboxylase
VIACDEFYRALKREGIACFAGVPDSLLKDICSYINDRSSAAEHTITANEGSAIALVAGHHLATGDLGLVYMQNSGLGNAINPLMSLTDPEVYSIPMILLVGWRGEPGVADEPQHRKQGRVTVDTLDALQIPHAVLPEETSGALQCLATAVAIARERQSPYVLLARKDSFSKYRAETLAPNDHEMTREEAIVTVLGALTSDDLVVATTGMTSREVFEYRERAKHPRGRDFLTVGCMGHASQIALGVARAQTKRLVYCLDGDGACIMHLGGLSTVGVQRAGNLRHIVINNGAHDSVGGQPTAGFQIDLPGMARACGYLSAQRVGTKVQLRALMPEFMRAPGPSMLEILVRRGARADLGRPTRSPIENKIDFMTELKSV